MLHIDKGGDATALLSLGDDVQEQSVEVIWDPANTYDDAKIAEVRKYAAEVIAPDLMTIARRGQGSMRDAESLLDQAVNLGEGKVTDDVVRQIAGAAPDETLLFRVNASTARAAAAPDAGISASASSADSRTCASSDSNASLASNRSGSRPLSRNCLARVTAPPCMRHFQRRPLNVSSTTS